VNLENGLEIVGACSVKRCLHSVIH